MSAEKSMDYEHRRQRLLELVDLIERSGGKKAWFANAIEKSSDYLSRLLYEPGKKGRKNLGDELMTAITVKLGLPSGWFDLPVGSSLPPTLQIDRAGAVRMPEGWTPPPSHSALPFDQHTIDGLLDLPQKWQGRAEQAVIEILKEYQRNAPADDDPPEHSSPVDYKPVKGAAFAGGRRRRALR